MTCKDAHEYLLDAAQGSAADPGLEEHLCSCASCAQQLQSLRQTMTLLDEWEAPEPSPYFDSRLHARVREVAAAAAPSWLDWLRKPAIAFALAVLMVVGITLFRNAPSHNAASNQNPPAVTQTGTAVSDLQELEHDEDMYANFDLLDDLGNTQETANP